MNSNFDASSATIETGREHEFQYDSNVEVTFMPLFEFRCPPCERDFELLLRNGEQAACPHCGSKSIEKLLSEAAPPVASSARALPIASTCPPGDAPCGPRCCRL